jgi:hypothetical protein
MKYLKINSDFIDREFHSILNRAIKGIKSTISDNKARGEVDSIMSSFGKQFDSFTEDYFIDHVRVSRKFNYRDSVTPDVLRILNTYKKVGVHKMFEKLYPDAFVKRVRRSPTQSYGIDTVKIILKGLLENIMSSHSSGLSLDRAERRIIQYLNGNGIRNISMYFDGPYLDMMQDNLTLRDRYVKANKYNGLFDNIRRGKYDLDVDDEEAQQHDKNYDVPDFESKAAASIYESFKSKPSNNDGPIKI